MGEMKEGRANISEWVRRTRVSQKDKNNLHEDN
jgi:hypothetical protein